MTYILMEEEDFRDLVGWVSVVEVAGERGRE